MGRQVLLGHPGVTWRSWLRENRGDRDLILLDPADGDHGSLARLCLFRADRAISWRFYGSLDPLRSPHVAIAALAQMLQLAGEDAIVQSFPLHGGPLTLQTQLLAMQLVRPNRILIAEGTDLRANGLPVEPEMVQLEPSFPDQLKHAQRKALWLKLAESCARHEVDLRRVAVEGARLGSGHRVDAEQLARLGLPTVQHAEACGGTLLLVADEEPDEGHVARALDVFHCGRAHVVKPDSYRGLLCSFARQDGEDFGMGFVEEIDFCSGRALVQCDAVSPAPVRILRLGALRIDREGQELGEVRPWQV